MNMSSDDRPRIEGTSFGSIVVEGEYFDHDIFITLDGKVKKRKKKLSKEIYGTSHTISLLEIKYVFQAGADGIVIGSGQYGAARLSEEASAYLKKNGCRFLVKPTPDAIDQWNTLPGNWIGLFHITC
jgi:hypothetical protein